MTTGSGAASIRVKTHERMTKVYYIVMVLVILFTVLFLTMTPSGRRLAEDLRPGLVMDFETQTFMNIFQSWYIFGIIVALIVGFYGASEADGGGFVGGLIGGVMAYALICLLWVGLVNYVFPFFVNAGAYLLGGIMCLAFAIGCSVAIVNYVKKFKLYADPYPETAGVYCDGIRNYYEDKHGKKEEYGQRSYFFGPGFFSIKETIWYSWRANFQLIVNVVMWLGVHTDGFEWLWWILGVPYLIFYSLSVVVFGSAITIICSLIHAVPLIAVMIIIYILFTVTWIVDRIYLNIHSVNTSCPYDQTRNVIPMFKCSSCNHEHWNLVPGPYGIWHRRCTCGELLPTTFLMGRSNLKAYCKLCGHELAASDAQQLSLAIVGGKSSGKTVLLASFFHEFFKEIDNNENVSYTIPTIHEAVFEKLNDWFEGERCDSTAKGETAETYSVLLKSDVFDVEKQFSLYDIAGEAFDDPSMVEMLPQQHMKDSDGIIFVVDPLSSTSLRNAAKNEGDDTSNFSENDADVVVQNFTTYLKTVLTNEGITNKSRKPVAVVITKTDLTKVSRKISYSAINSAMRENPGKYECFDDARDDICRSFLKEINLENTVRSIEEGFTNVHYFPVSAIGHAANYEEFAPVHVIEPFYWLLNNVQPAIVELLSGDSDN